MACTEPLLNNLTNPVINATIELCVYLGLYWYYAPYFVLGEKSMPIPNLCLSPQARGWWPTVQVK